MKPENHTDPRLDEFLLDMGSREPVQRMKAYVQHGKTSTYDHCIHVVRLSNDINKTFHIHADTDTLLMGALLHDFYLYDWHEADESHKWHGFTHAQKAAQNARKYFQVNPGVLQVIESHMWPLNLTRIPRSREAWIVCLADKCVSLQETFEKRPAHSKKHL